MPGHRIGRHLQCLDGGQPRGLSAPSLSVHSSAPSHFTSVERSQALGGAEGDVSRRSAKAWKRPANATSACMSAALPAAERHALKLQGSRAEVPDRMPRRGNMSRFGLSFTISRKPSIVSLGQRKNPTPRDLKKWLRTHLTWINDEPRCGRPGSHRTVGPSALPPPASTGTPEGPAAWTKLAMASAAALLPENAFEADARHRDRSRHRFRSWMRSATTTGLPSYGASRRARSEGITSNS